MRKILICVLALLSFGTVSYGRENNNYVTGTTTESTTYQYNGTMVVTVNGVPTTYQQSVKAIVNDNLATLNIGTLKFEEYNIPSVYIPGVPLNDDGTITNNTTRKVYVSLFPMATATFTNNSFVKENCELHITINNIPGKTITVDYQGN